MGSHGNKVPSRLSGEKVPLFPVFVKLIERRCLVVGAGKTAEGKIPSLLRCGANVMVVAPTATRTVRGWAAEDKIIWEQRRFEVHDLDGIFLVLVATPLKALNRTVFELARERQILCNAVRDRALCDFYCANSWSPSSGRNGRAGCAGLVKRVPVCTKIRYLRSDDAPCCIVWRARRSKLNFSDGGASSRIAIRKNRNSTVREESSGSC
jgi:hypothetical protein